MTKKEIINSNRPIADYVANTSPYVFTLHHIEYGIDDYAYVLKVRMVLIIDIKYNMLKMEADFL